MSGVWGRLCDWVEKDVVWVHRGRITDGRVTLDMRLADGLDPDTPGGDGRWLLSRDAAPLRIGDDRPDLTGVLPAPVPAGAR
ncbi:hypothetical protein AB0G74_30120 [Streptomyces sp. NPDC020875]|uniref:hypothetical protein n=1 Tax=Streptomyces sp. NPDC020875 TaxID=3154898 RepID=UPI0033D73C0B